MSKRKDRSKRVTDFEITFDEHGRIDTDAFEKWQKDLSADSKRKQRHSSFRKAASIAIGVAIGTTLAHRVMPDTDVSAAKWDDLTILSDVDTPTELKLGAVASSTSGVGNVVVICDADLSLFDNNPKDDYMTTGVTLYPDETVSGNTDILLYQSFCNFIQDAEYVPEAGYVALAVFSLAHEIGHVTGEYDEGKTNCLAVDLYPTVRDQLGLTDLLHDFAAADIAKVVGSSQYHDAGC